MKVFDSLLKFCTRLVLRPVNHAKVEKDMLMQNQL